MGSVPKLEMAVMQLFDCILRLKVSKLLKFYIMILSTTPTIEGHTIREYKGVVTGETIIGANFVKDFFAGIRDIVGGRSALKPVSPSSRYTPTRDEVSCMSCRRSTTTTRLPSTSALRTWNSITSDSAWLWSRCLRPMPTEIAMPSPW